MSELRETAKNWLTMGLMTIMIFLAFGALVIVIEHATPKEVWQFLYEYMVFERTIYVKELN